MPNSDFSTSSLPEQNSGFDPKLSAMLDLLIQHEERLRDELIKTKQLRQQLENLIPNSPFKNFISNLKD